MPDNITERPRVYLNSVHLKGYKSIEDLTIDFQKGLNILIGKNGAGKSNFLEFVDLAVKFNRNKKVLFNYAKVGFDLNNEHSFIFELLKDLHSPNVKDEFDDETEIFEKFIIDNRTVFDNTFDDFLKGSFEFNNKNIAYRGSLRSLFIRLGYPYINPVFIKFHMPNNLECINLPGILNGDIETPFYEWTYPKTLNFVNEILSKIEIFYDKNPDSIKDISSTSILKLLKIPHYIKENLRSYTSIEDVQFNKNVNFYSDEKSIIIENIKLDFKINGNWLPWSQLSDGTRRLFYIVSEVTFNKGLVLIEEPELGIHPHQFNLLMDFLKEQSEDKQIIISTHSPKALDHLSEDELGNILIAYYDLDKGTQIRHLTEKEEKKAKRYMKEVGFFSDYWMLSDLE